MSIQPIVLSSSQCFANAMIGSRAIGTRASFSSLANSCLRNHQQIAIDSQPIEPTSQHYKPRPIYSLSGKLPSASGKLLSATSQCGQLLYMAQRWANTSSGSYAPSTMANSHLMDTCRNSAGNLTVFEDNEHLPRLPVPDMMSTLAKLKESISLAAMNSGELANALNLIDEFSQTAGPKLDLLLKAKASQTKNWLTHDWWVTEAYLKNRKSLVINSNPGMIYPRLPYEVKNQRALVNHISQLISGVIDFKLALIQGCNPEASSAEGEFRLDSNVCYSQYRNLFGTLRKPGEEIDTLESAKVRGGGEDSLELVLAFRGKFFSIVLNDVENEKNRTELLANIVDKIINSSDDSEGLSQQVELNGIGVLTTTNRVDWSRCYHLLDPESLKSIQNAEFIISIDAIAEQHDDFQEALLNEPEESPQRLGALGRQILHGDTANVGNRWFDKPIQLVIVTDKHAERLIGAGINYEHSFAEGIVVSKLIEHSHDKAIQLHRDSANQSSKFAKQQVLSKEPASFSQLRMVEDTQLDSLKDRLKKARQDYASQLAQFDLSYLDYKQYGRNAIKSWHFSPDSWFQVALSSAYYNVHRRLGPCYESASTRQFAFGRTETIRSLTRDVAQYCLEPRFETLQAAIRSHKSYALSANQGNGIDRVLTGYQLTYQELKSNTWAWGLPAPVAESQGPKLFDQVQDGRQCFNLLNVFTEDELNILNAFFHNELIKRSSKFALSTSQVSSIHPDVFMSYGPLVADGYGCCYNISGQQIVGAISANSSNQSFSCEVHRMTDGVKESLSKMRDIVQANGRSQKCS